MWPPAKIITISTEPIAIGARPSAPVLLVAMPTVNRNRNIPMNSTESFLSSGCVIRTYFSVGTQVSCRLRVTGVGAFPRAGQDDVAGRVGGGSGAACIGARVHLEGRAGMDF